MNNTTRQMDLMSERDAVVSRLMMLLTLTACAVALCALDAWTGALPLAFAATQVALVARKLATIHQQLQGRRMAEVGRFGGAIARRPGLRGVVPAKTSAVGSILATTALIFLWNGWRAIEGSDEGTYLLGFALAAMIGNAGFKIFGAVRRAAS